MNMLKHSLYFSLTFIAITCLSRPLHAQDTAKKAVEIDPRPFADNFNHWYMGYNKSNIVNPMPGRPKYKPSELKNIGDNILLFQKANGGWPKNYDIFAVLTPSQKDSVFAVKNILNTTFDNGSCFTQIAALAVVYNATKEEKYKNGALKGLDYLLTAQYKNGGWPQYFPLEANYSKEITFNDGVFTGIMELLENIKDNDPQYLFINDDYRKRVKMAYIKGLDCVIKTQINDTGKLTAWCQQHDAVTLKPVWARKFEPASICNAESAELVLFLMRIDKPEAAVINAVQYAVAWFQDSKIYNTKVNTIPAPKLVTPFRVSTTDRVVVNDTAARPIWTRYYELKTHKPIFCNRDSKIVYTLAEVDRERRDGYAWYTYAPQKVLDKYHKWQMKWDAGKDVLTRK